MIKTAWRVYILVMIGLLCVAGYAKQKEDVPPVPQRARIYRMSLVGRFSKSRFIEDSRLRRNSIPLASRYESRPTGTLPVLNRVGGSGRMPALRVCA